MGLFWGTKIRALDVTKDDGNYIGVERQKSIVTRFRLQPNQNFVISFCYLVFVQNASSLPTIYHATDGE